MNINFEKNSHDIIACEICVKEKLHAKLYKTSIKRINQSLKLIHDDLMKFIFKNHDLLMTYNETLYVFILLNDFI